MAKQYFAVNQIQFGQPDGEIKVFEPGDKVEGLSKDQMIELWAAGVLREVDPNARPADDRDAEIERLKTQIAALEAEKAAAVEAAVEEPEAPATTEDPTVTDPAANGASGDPVTEPTE
jgi:hypothetical protein